MFKVIFPAGYNVIDVIDDNLDINVILESGKVFFATLFTISNIKSLMLRDEAMFFLAEDMVIVADLEKDTIRRVVQESINDGFFERTFCQIGLVEDIYGIGMSYDGLNDMIRE